jgi:hypothetical protein
MLIEAKCVERNCKWYEGIKQPNEDELIEFHYCKAFPDGILRDIILGKNLHDEVIEGQKGDFIYEKTDDDIE